MFQTVAHTGITVTDLDRSIAFYRDVLGLHFLGEMSMGGPESAQLFRRPDCSARVAYLRSEDPSAPPVELIQFTDCPVVEHTPTLFESSISELCFAVEDIDEEYRRLTAQGVEFLSQPQTFDSRSYGFGVSRAVYFYDPDHNILELIQPLF